MLESEESLGCDEKFELPVELEGRSGELRNGREDKMRGSQLRNVEKEEERVVEGERTLKSTSPQRRTRARSSTGPVSQA